jgi:L-threonylcarbamoyladenylate synthase
MAAEILTIGPETVSRHAANRCRTVLQTGGVIVYPTDTLYALGADPRNAEAVRRLFTIKGRGADRPILVLIPDSTSVPQWAMDVSDTAERLMKRFWPGPLTLVFRARPDVLPELTAGSGKIGLRVPGNSLTVSLLMAAAGKALTGTSANRSGGRAPSSIETVIESIGKDVDLVLDAGPAVEVRSSTVVDVSGAMPSIIREGVIGREQLM